MIYLGTDIEKDAAMSVAKLMAAAAKTAPKGCGEDNVEVLTRREQEIPHFYKNATEKVVSLVSQGVKYVQKCSLIIKYC